MKISLQKTLISYYNNSDNNNDNNNKNNNNNNHLGSIPLTTIIHT